MKMKVVLLLVLLAILTTLSIRPSLAATNEDDVENLGCWLNITSCLRDNDEVLSCCPIIRQEIDDERDCICSAKETLLQNATTAASINVIFTFCDISDSFQTLCPDEDSDSSSAPMVSPDSSSPSSITSSSPAEEPSPPSPTSDDDETSTPATEEVSTPSPDESVTADVGNNCWTRIVNCTESKSESDELECCPVFKQEIEDERDCFCSGAKLAILEDPSEADSFDKYLNLCEVRESLDALCPSTDTSSNNAAGAKIPRKGNTLNMSGSNKVNIAHNSFGLLLISSLFIILALSNLI